MVPAHGQVHEGEHVELCHDGEAEEHTVQEEAPTAQLLVQLPLVQMDAEHLGTQRGSDGAGEGDSCPGPQRGPVSGCSHLSEGGKIKDRAAQNVRQQEDFRR